MLTSLVINNDETGCCGQIMYILTMNSTTYANKVVVEPSDDNLFCTQVHELQDVFIRLHQANELGVAVEERPVH